MLTRIIYKDGNVYYRVRDLKEYFDLTDYKMRKIIKVSEVETVKLESFGNTSFIREEDISLLDINGGGIIMRTEYKDYQQTYESNQSMDNFFNFLSSNRLPKKTPEELYIKTMDELDSFRDNAKHKKEDEDKYHMKRELFNELCEKYGYSERVVYARFVSRNEYFELPVIINGNGTIVDSTTRLDYCYCEESLDYLKHDVANGELVSDEGEKLILTKGKPFNIPSDSWLLKQIFKLLSENEIEQSCVDWIDVKLQNGNQISVYIDILLALMTNNIRIVTDEPVVNNDQSINENKFEENEIIDVDFEELKDAYDTSTLEL